MSYDAGPYGLKLLACNISFRIINIHKFNILLYTGYGLDDIESLTALGLYLWTWAFDV